MTGRVVPLVWVFFVVISVCFGGGAVWGATPLVETIDMYGSGDNADDMCLWLHPTDPSKSVILGNNKSGDANGGIYSFALNGGRSDGAGSWGLGNWFDQGKKINNVDLRYNFQAGDDKWDIVVGSNRTNDRIDILRVDTNEDGDFTGLTSVGSISTGADLGPADNPYGMAMFHSKSRDKHYALASSYNGQTAQWELSYNAGPGTITGTKVWQADVTGGNVIEGIVADDEKEVVYIAGEDSAIYRYQTINGVIQNADRVEVDHVSGAHLAADIEGLTLYYGSDGAGYLIASSQGDSEFAVYDREFSGGAANGHIFNFTIGANSGAGIDSVHDTDGIDVTNADLGGQFDSGMFLAHDGNNSGRPISNVKLVPWSDVADETVPNLIIDTTWDPRSVGRSAVPGDTDGDGDVDAVDYGNLIAQFGGPPGGDGADFNDDGAVDIGDFTIQRAAFSAATSPGGGPGPDPAATPEPTTISLLAWVCLGVLARRRRRDAA